MESINRTIVPCGKSYFHYGVIVNKAKGVSRGVLLMQSGKLESIHWWRILSERLVNQISMCKEIILGKI